MIIDDRQAEAEETYQETLEVWQFTTTALEGRLPDQETRNALLEIKGLLEQALDVELEQRKLAG
jgi:hypothetical protein